MKLLVKFGLALWLVVVMHCNCWECFAEPQQEGAVEYPESDFKKTLTRTQDFVVVHGKHFQQSLHKKIDKMSLFALNDGKFTPIPFQIDEINEDGEWVLPDFPPYMDEKKVRVDVDDDCGKFDENDELVFMIRDSGDKAASDLLPEGAAHAEEVLLTDAALSGRAWVYLCYFPDVPAPKSEKDYVDYVFPQNRVISDEYELGFSLKVPISWDYISFRGAPNMIDRMKLRFNIKLFGIKYYFDETNFTSELSLFKDGQIRVIRRVRSAVYLSKILRSPSAASESIYYDNAVVIPFRIKIPVSPAPFRRFIDIKMHGGVDMQNMHGWRLQTNVDPRWLSIDGKMDETEKNIKGEGAVWFLAIGPPGAMLNRMILNKRPDGSPQKLPLETEFFYIDDDETPDPPEFVPGQSPNIGYWMRNLEMIPRGTFYFYLINYMIKGEYKKGVEQEYLDIIDKPVKAFVH